MTQTTTELTEIGKRESHTKIDSIQSVSGSATNSNQSLSLASVQRTYPWRKLLANEFFAARIIIILITIFILILCISYAVGQVLSLVLDDYWCDFLSWSEVQQHSILTGEPRGVTNECWTAKSATVSNRKLWSGRSYGYRYNSQSSSSIAKCFAFSLLSTILLMMTAYFVFKLVVDSIKYRKGQLKASTNVPKWNSWPIISTFSSISAWWTSNFGVDTGKWIIMRILSEIIEVILQSNALLLYNGTSDDSNIFLAYDSKFIILFSVFLFLNCLSNAILWSLYAFKPIFCHGILFETILCSIDIVYDLFYALFPIIVVFSNQDDADMLVSLASLQTNDALSFWATFFPLLLLATKCWSLSNQTMNEMRAYKFYSNQHPANTAQLSTQSAVIQAHISNVPNIGKIGRINSWVIRETEVNINHPPKTCFCYIHIRRIIVMFMSTIFCIYGCIVLALVTSHFQTSIGFCNQIVSDIYNNNTTMLSLSAQQTLNERPQLFLWDFCKQKVYPFDTKCDCRGFKFDYKSSDIAAWDSDELKQYFGIDLIDIISNVFKSFRMLQKIRVAHIMDAYGNKKLYSSINFTSDMFIATKLQVLDISELNIGYIAPQISNLKDLQYLSFANCDIGEFPDTLSQLSELQYLEFTNVNAQNGYLPPICPFTKLKVLKLFTSAISEIPHCVKHLKALEIIFLINLTELKYIPLELLNLEHLTDLTVERAFQVTIHSLMEYNNISDIDEFNNVFEYNPNANFSFQESGVCGSVISDTFRAFTNETKSCVPVCSHTVNAFGCRVHEWRDGICDKDCKSAACLYDGGDCHQLCECDNYWHFLGNGECDLLCNTSNCNWDEGDCITTINFDADRCELEYEEHGCNVTWVNDNWCDSNCNNLVCAFDGGDCEHACGQAQHCRTLWELFDFVANSDDADNKISQSEICAAWIFLKSDPSVTIKNCTQFMVLYDINKDNLVSPYEALTGLSVMFDVTEEKAAQIDCSDCLADPEDYL